MAYVQRCDKCQKFAKSIQQPLENLSDIILPWKFAQWGVDILRPFPLFTVQWKFVIVAAEYFTKWPEAKAVAIITQKFMENIICRFGIPHILVVDNGP